MPSALHWLALPSDLRFHLHSVLFIEHTSPNMPVLASCRNQNINRLREFDWLLDGDRVLIGFSGPRKARLIKCAFCLPITCFSRDPFHCSSFWSLEKHIPHERSEIKRMCFSINSHRETNHPIKCELLPQRPCFYLLTLSPGAEINACINLVC